MDGKTQEYRDLLFGIRRSIRYHSHRQRYYQNVHNCVLFLALLLGSAPAVALIMEVGQGWEQWVKVLPGVIVSVAVAFDFVVGSMRKVGLHTDFIRQFTDLERQLIAGEYEDKEKIIARVADKRLEIETMEPPVLQVLDTICHNELLRTMGYPRKDQIAVRWFQRLFANFCDVNAHSLSAHESA